MYKYLAGIYIFGRILNSLGVRLPSPVQLHGHGIRKDIFLTILKGVHYYQSNRTRAYPWQGHSPKPYRCLWALCSIMSTRTMARLMPFFLFLLKRRHGGDKKDCLEKKTFRVCVLVVLENPRWYIFLNFNEQWMIFAKQMHSILSSWLWFSGAYRQKYFILRLIRFFYDCYDEWLWSTVMRTTTTTTTTSSRPDEANYPVHIRHVQYFWALAEPSRKWRREE